MIASRTKKATASTVLALVLLCAQPVRLHAQPPCPSSKVTALTGAGSTFSYPLYAKMFEAYEKLCGVKVTYQPIGSGAGIREFQKMAVDFGASDGIMTADQEARAGGGAAFHIPTTVGAVAITYNLPTALGETLKLRPDVIADIYLRRITKWDDPRIKALNPQASLPSLNITPIYRSDGSGTTFIFSNYLSKVSKEWADKVGFGNVVNWPTGGGGNGNAGVANQVKLISGAIGYVEFAYAIHNRLHWASIRNKAGNFVAPNIQGAAAAADTPDLPDDMKVIITDSDAPDAYPISGFSWVLVYKDGKDTAKTEALAHLVWWMTHAGQDFSESLNYAPLKKAAVIKAENLLRQVTAGGQPVFAAD